MTVYAVRVGRNPGLYSQWFESVSSRFQPTPTHLNQSQSQKRDLCKQQVDKFPQSEFKSFKSVTEAAEFLKQPSKTGKRISESVVASMAANLDANKGTSFADESVAGVKRRADDSTQQPKKQRTSTSASVSIKPSTNTHSSTRLLSIDSLKPVTATATTPSNNSDSEQPQIKGITQRITVYTDGACSGNGQRHARGGIGVFFGDGDPRNISEPLPGPVQTNNRAELLAVIRALRACPPNAAITIKTDSTYVRKGITEWISNWLRNNWRNSKGDAVVNKDLWEELVVEMNARNRDGVKNVDIEYIKAHAGMWGNDQADQLAVEGARRH